MIDREEMLSLLNLNRRARRRILAGYWVCVLALIAFFAVIEHRGNSVRTIPVTWFLVAAVWMPLMLRNIRASLNRPMVIESVMPHPPGGAAREDIAQPMDERERQVDARMHVRAYAYLYVFALPLVGFLTTLEDPKRVGLTYLRVPLLLLLWIVVASLPQSLTLWNEPDHEEVR